MKLLHAKLPHLTVSVPLRGGFHVTFTDHQATVPNDVADLLVALHPTFYRIIAGGLPPPGGSILVVRDMGLGDVLLITPLLRALAAYGLHVSVMTLARYVPLLDGNASVADCFAIEEGRSTSGYDMTLDLRLHVENAENQGDHAHRVDGFARAADIQLSPEERTLDYCVTPAEHAAAEALWGNTQSPRVAMVWRSSTANRNWPETRSRTILAGLLAAGLSVAVLDQEAQDLGPVPYPGSLSALRDLTGQHSIRQVGAVMAGADVVLCPDTGLFHLASALNKPIVTYFGPMPIAERATHQALTVLDNRAGCGIFPCRRYFCLRQAEDGTSACLDVPAGEVVHAVQHAVNISREMCQ